MSEGRVTLGLACWLRSSLNGEIDETDACIFNRVLVITTDKYNKYKPDNENSSRVESSERREKEGIKRAFK